MLLLHAGATRRVGGSLAQHLARRALASSAATRAGVGGWGAGGLTPEQADFQALASDFARDHLTPHAAHWDEASEFPVATLRRAAELGFDGAVIFEALAYGDVPFSAYLTIHNMVCGVINRNALEGLKQRYLPRLASLELLSAYCLTEPSSGSDAAAMRTTATRVDGGYTLSGSKAFISGGGVAHVYVVFARLASDGSGGGGGGAGGTGGAAAPAGADKGITAFLVEKSAPGLSFGAPERKMGWRMQPTCVVSLDRVFVPSEAVIGAEGGGFKIAMAALDGGRVNIGACSVGGATFCLDTAYKYSSERLQFGQPIGRFQASQFKLADMATRLAASRLMVRHAAAALDAQAPEATMLAAMAKRFASDECFQVALDTQQLLGGYGFLRDFPAERLVRDLRVHSILEGTNEVMRLVISRQLARTMGD